jgi:hypothetical protein
LPETVKTQIPIYVYLHFHWDREWFLTASTARALLLDRVRKTLSALESGELPSFYLDGQAVVLEDLIEIEPEFGPRIKAAMSLGKLSAGPWYVLPDQSLVGGESLVRNLKLGIEITSRFGNSTMTGYNPDTFCHVQDLPRILQGMGIDTAIVLRGVPPLPGTNVFWWDSPDGSRVLTYLLNKGLTHQVFHKTADGREIAKDLMARWDLGSADDTTAPMLYSAGGEGMQPPGDLAHKLASVNANLPKNCQAKVVSIDEFLNSFEHWAAGKALPEIVGELRDNRSINERFPAYILDGVSSTRLYLKRDNALSEHRLVRLIEPFFAMLHAKGIMAYPEGELRHVWKLLIQNHPHDSICGCSIDTVHQEMRTRTQQLQTFLDGLEMLAAEKIAEHANKGTNSDGKLSSALPVTTGLQPTDPDNGYDRLLIQNTSGYAQRAPVKMTWYTDPEKPSSLPSVEVQLESQTDCPNLLFHSGGGFYYKKVRRFDGWLYPESEVPAMGSIESRWIGAQGIAPAIPQSANAGAQIKDATSIQSAQSSEIDNGLLKARVDSAGNLVVVINNSGGKEREITLRHDICDVGDGGDSYNFDPLLNDTEVIAEFISVKKGKEGPLLASLLLNYTLDIPEGLDTKTVSEDDLGKGRSKELIKHTIQTEITLKKGVPILFFNTTFENRSADHRLSVRLHTGRPVRESWSECHFSIARRVTPVARPELPVPVGHEVLPESFFCQRFFILQGQVFFNLGLPEYRTAEDYAEITLLRSVSWLSRGRLRTRGGGAGPWDATPEANCFGLNRCEYAWAFLGESEQGRLADEQIIQSYKLADLFEGRLVAHAIGNFTDANEQSLITITNPAIYLASTYIDHGKLYLRLLNITATSQTTNLKSALPLVAVAKVSLSGKNPKPLTISKEAKGATTFSLNFGQNELLTIALDLSPNS